MANVKVKLDRNFEKNLQKQLKNNPPQRKLDEAAQSEVRAVNLEMRGGDAEQIHSTLIARIAALGFEPNKGRLRELAQAISDGELGD